MAFKLAVAFVALAAAVNGAMIKVSKFLVSVIVSNYRVVFL